MKWYNLKQNKCPQCDKDLDFTNPQLFSCECGFKISEKRFKEITTDQTKQAVNSYFEKRGEQNLYD